MEHGRTFLLRDHNKVVTCTRGAIIIIDFYIRDHVLKKYVYFKYNITIYLPVKGE